jgi:hypothetical protein
MKYLKVKVVLFCFLLLSFGIISKTKADVRVNQDILGTLQNEPSITLNPSVPGNIVVGYNEGPGVLGISYSLDFGATWADTQITPVWGGEFDPSADADQQGNIFIGFCSSSGPFFYGTTGVYVAVSSDSGKTWTNTNVETFYGSANNPVPYIDKDYIAVDNYPGSPNVDNVYIVWERDTWDNVHAAVYAAVSYDNGASFTNIQKVSDSAWSKSQAVGQVPKVAPNGDVYVVWADYALSGHVKGYFYIDKSTDGGASWGNDILVDSFLAVPRFPNPSAPSFYVRTYPSLGVDPSNSNKVYIAYAADPDGVTGPDDGDIFLLSSYDGGITWNAPVRVNDDNTTNDQFQPWIDVKQNGTIDIVWIDRRNDTLDWLFEVYFSYSTDYGQTFSPNMLVSDATIGPLPHPNSWMGEYIGIDVDSSMAYIAWTDTRMGDSDIFFDTVTNPPTNTKEGSKVPSPGIQVLAISPNPTRGITEILYQLEIEGPVSIEIFDASGRLVRDLSPLHIQRGANKVLWDGRNEHGLPAKSGVYFINLRKGKISIVENMLLIR